MKNKKNDIKIQSEKFDFDLLGVKNFNFGSVLNEIDEKPEDEEVKKFLLEVELSNDMEMMDLHDDLVAQGYIVRVK